MDQRLFASVIRACRRCSVALMLLLTSGAVSGFQDTPAIPKEAGKRENAKRDPLEFWFEPARAQAGAAAQLILAQNPFTAAALRIAGSAYVVWAEAEFAGDRVPPLNLELLRSAAERDSKPMPTPSGRPPTKAERDYMNLYNQAVLDSFRTPLDAFIQSAKDNKYVTFAHMRGQPATYRGKVIPVKGHLKRLRKFEAPQVLQAQGVKDLYEGWITVPTYGTYPICVIFPILPDGLEPAESFMGRWVEFYGYFINRYRYHSGRGDLETPFLIGPTLIATNAPPPQDGEVITPSILYGLVGFILLVAIGVVVLNIWFRRGDRRVQEHLDHLRDQRALEAMSNPETFEEKLGDNEPGATTHSGYPEREGEAPAEP